MRKLFLSLLFSILLIGNSQAEDRFWVLGDFSKGLNSHISDYNTPDNQAHESTNTRFNNRYGALGTRNPLLSEVDFGTGAVTGLYRYYNSDGTIRTLGSIGTYLKTEVNGTNVTIDSGLTDGKRFQFVTYQDVVIASNGYDQPKKWDGVITTTNNTTEARTAGELCADLGAPFATLSTGTDLNASSWYQYKVAFWDGSTYDYSNARSNPILTGSTVYNINLTDIPIGPEGTVCRYIYRTLGDANQTAVENDTTYYLVYNLTGNNVTTYHDNISDAIADNDTAPNWTTVSAGSNVTPPMGSIVEIISERLFISGNTAYPSDIYWSDEFNPDHFLPSDFIQVRPDDGDKITFIKPFLGTAVVGKTNSIQKLYTTDNETSGWYTSDPYSLVGCPAPYSAAVTPKGIAYLSRAGIYLFSGQYSNLISDAVTPQINDISQTNIAETVGYYSNGEYRISYTSESSGEAINNRVLIYDFTRDAYALDLENVNCFASFGSGTDFGALYSGSSTTDGYVFAHNPSAYFLTTRYKSQFDLGTYNDTRSYGTENAPYEEIAWDCNISGWLTELQTKDGNITNISSIGTYLPNATIARPDTSGTWTSPVYDVKAQAYDKLYWNENLGSYGDATFQIRTGPNSTVDGSWSNWTTATSNPSGSDISSATAARYVQVQFNLSTTDIDYSPTLYQADGYVFRLSYSKVGAEYETSVVSLYKTGWKDFGVSGYRKQIKRIKVFYQGDSGSLAVNYKNDEGDIDKTLTIDFSVLPDASSTDQYSGDTTNKIYTFYPGPNSEEDPTPIGQFFQFTLTGTGISDGAITKIEVQFEPLPELI